MTEKLQEHQDNIEHCKSIFLTQQWALTIVGGAIITVGCICWWLGSTFTAIHFNQRQQDENYATLNRQQSNYEQRLTNFETQLYDMNSKLSTILSIIQPVQKTFTNNK